MVSSIGATWRSFWHTMTSSDRHASHDSPYRTGQHMPLNQSRHAPLTSVATATSALDSRADLSSPYPEDNVQSSNTRNGWSGSPGPIQSPTSPYSPGMRSAQMNLPPPNESDSYDSMVPGEIQMQSFHEGLPPPPPVSHSWKRIDRWVEDNYEELYDQLSEGCTQNDINELEHELDCSLPIELRESLQCHDGQERGGQPTGIIFGCMLLDCEEIVQEWKNWRTVNEEYLTTPPNHNGTSRASAGASSSSTAQPNANPFWRQELLDKQDSQPPKAIQKAYAHPGWIPLARDWGGNNIAVDLAPGPAGKWGQIIIFGRDYDCKYVVARSWAAFLAMVADDIGSEKVFVDDETQELKLREFKASGVEPGYLDILRWRMDQKYGRRIPKKRAPNGLGVNTNNLSRASGSPYQSPIEERGRSAHRLSGPGPNSQSPRSAMGKSPLSQVQDENTKPVAAPLATEPEDKADGDTPKIDKLVEVSTPTLGPTEKEFEEAKLAATADDDNDKENKTKPVVNGLGVDGIEDMKTVAI